MKQLLKKLFPSYNDKEILRYRQIVEKINKTEEKFLNFTEENFVEKTNFFKEELKNGKKLDDILVEALALAKVGCRFLTNKKFEYKKGESTEIWQMVPYDVQLIGAMILNEGKIAEMKTGEGKTLVAALALYLNALDGKGAHLVTVNQYLAERDAKEMGILFNLLGLSVGVISQEQDVEAKKEAYNSDITYGTNNNYGFDYLRDNMVPNVSQIVMRDLHFAIVDEVDSILIDEARTPLIISAPADESTDKYVEYAILVKNLIPEEDFKIDEKMKTATLTEEGVSHMEKLMGVENIYTEKGFQEVHHIEQALKATYIFKKDKDYMVSPDGEILIVDEFTGRLMKGRRFGQGLHQAIEAKEGVKVQKESKTLASITFQNFFRLYEKLAGMTGTAETEAEEFGTIYGLDTIVVPTNRPIVRMDRPDAIFKSANGKYLAIARKVKELREKGQPVLIGTVSVEKSEILSSVFNREGIPHSVLNAKYHEKEAEIISQAGQKGAVTIATNMAGRGTDIKLGEGVKELGGLFILGSERHESRRIDNQLRGRGGRQGDPGESQFYISMDDDLMRIFGSEKMKNMMHAMGVPDDMPIENGMITKSVEGAQQKVETHHFDSRKHIVKYDDVLNKHRQIIYERRKAILFGDDISDLIREQIKLFAERIVDAHTLDLNISEWDYKIIWDDVAGIHNFGIFSLEYLQEHGKTKEKMIEIIFDFLLKNYESKKEFYTVEGNVEIFKTAQREIYLQTIDSLWMEHLDNMSRLREQTSLAGYGQRDPLLEYKKEAFKSFKNLIGNIGRNMLSTFFKSEFGQFPSEKDLPVQPINLNVSDIQKNLNYGEDFAELNNFFAQQRKENSSQKNIGGVEIIGVDYEKIPKGGKIINAYEKTSVQDEKFKGVGRNDKCPCGSGKKFKKCCGR
ncbi:preprotein translocase subunit SecA [Candidatus Gracilibacteria bacterium]|nr:preprotein translocase subunit SecA [Candidatus Gracilibacteria bacterium]